MKHFVDNAGNRLDAVWVDVGPLIDYRDFNGHMAKLYFEGDTLAIGGVCLPGNMEPNTTGWHTRAWDQVAHSDVDFFTTVRTAAQETIEQGNFRILQPSPGFLRRTHITHLE